MTLATSGVAALALLAVPAVSAPDGDSDFDLVCTGVGEHLEAHNVYGLDWDTDRHKYVHRSDIQYDRAQLEGTVQVEIHGGTGRIRPPARLLPPLASGGDRGWWELRDLRIEPDRIRASYKLNSLNVPTVDIDRRSGHIRIKGIETFEGSCNAFDPDKTRF